MNVNFWEVLSKSYLVVSEFRSYEGNFSGIFLLLSWGPLKRLRHVQYNSRLVEWFQNSHCQTNCTKNTLHSFWVSIQNMWFINHGLIYDKKGICIPSSVTFTSYKVVPTVAFTELIISSSCVLLYSMIIIAYLWSMWHT